MNWTFEADAPIFPQLIEKIKVGIVTGEFEPGERLPSLRNLSATAGVHTTTMRRAVAELERDGLVLNKRTAGKFVTSDLQMIAQAKQDLVMGYSDAFLAEMNRLGFCWDEIVILLEQERRAAETYKGFLFFGSAI